MRKEKVKSEDNAKQEYYPTNHRVRPDDMSITEAAVIGMKLAKKDPEHASFLQYMKNFAEVKE